MKGTYAEKTPEYDNAKEPTKQGPTDTKVRLNVGGQKFTTWSSTLAKLPRTRLSGLTLEDPAYDQEEKEYFFDRNPELFPYVLDAYRYGGLHVPESLCVPSIQDELLHWGLDEQLIPVSSGKTVGAWVGNKRISSLVESSLKLSPPSEAAGCRQNMDFVWRFLDDARTSKFAAIWLVFYTLLLILSLAVVIVWSCPGHIHNSALMDTNTICSFFFLLELLLRFASCPKKSTFFCYFFNIIDFLHTFFMFIYCCLDLAGLGNVAYLSSILAISTFFRAVRVIKIALLSWKMQVLLLTLWTSVKELSMLLLMEIVLTVAFGSALFFIENSVNTYIHSIPTGMHWSIITLTTVGYGDIFPMTILGKLLAGLCALCGIVCIALAISIIMNNFNQVFARTERMMRENKQAVVKKRNKSV